MTPHAHVVVAIITGVASLAAADTALHRPGAGLAWGYGGDGTGVLAATPPKTFHAEKNAAWKLALPSYGLAHPVVVGDRVFVLCEPNRDRPWPLLVAVALADGREQWKVELNHLPATPLTPAQQTEAAKLLADFWRKYCDLQKLRHELRQAPDSKPAIEAQVAALGGVEWDCNPNGYWKAKFSEYQKLNDKHSHLKAATLTQDTWSTMGNYGGWVIGEAFATPVSDGERLYVSTAQGGFFCFDLAGKLMWMKHHPGVAGEYCRNGRSPIIWKNLLLSDITAQIRGIDRATGELRWSAPVDGEAFLTPVVVRCGGTDLVLCGRGQAFRLPDGAPLKIEGWDDFGTQAITKNDGDSSGRSRHPVVQSLRCFG